MHCGVGVAFANPTPRSDPSRSPSTAGRTGGGKTRFASALAARGRCVALSHDEWVVGLLGTQPGSEEFQRSVAPAHAG